METPATPRMLKWLGIVSLLLPPVSLIVMTKLPALSEFTIDLVMCYLAFCLIFPFFFGIYLLVNFFTIKTGIILILSILNIISPLWLFYILINLMVEYGGGFRINM